MNKQYIGKIIDSDFDETSNLVEFDDNIRVKGLKEHFYKDINWLDTTYFKHVKSKINKNGEYDGYKDISTFLRIRCAYLDDLFFSMKKNGYVKNKIIGNNVPSQDGRFNRYDSSLEPLVIIGSNGHIFLKTGVHRVTIAKIIGIKKIPVNV
ncbi:hypothetical protein [Methanosalsum natronophilum]|uniref:hypothetical protein n=1 Tax=Methanosalsum natronophilum TaxID=768733 RepID=UPI0021676C63|nr:hypothetical protein [Methanosalsum natronophilum]MCS3923695.1 hypothetical protein [Methanosalsum natronophilum]